MKDDLLIRDVLATLLAFILVLIITAMAWGAIL